MTVERESPTMGITLYDSDNKKKSRTTVLIEIGNTLTLFHDPSKTAYAEISDDNHTEYWKLDSKSFREWLSNQYFLISGLGADRGSVHDSIATLSAVARVHGEEREVFIRIAGKDNKIFIDLCDNDWRVIEVDANGWRILDKSPVVFLRFNGMSPLQTPNPDGNINELWNLLNVAEEHHSLVEAFLVAALRDKGPYPILVLLGEQGTAKSSLDKVLRSLIDPSTVPLRAPPKEERDFHISAMNNWCVVFDNMSGMQAWLSDSMCRLSTGGGYSSRELYTNSDEVLVEIQRPSIINGIDDVATRPDFAERSLLLVLHPIPGNAKVSERIFNARVKKAIPAIFGAVLDKLSAAIRNIDSVHLTALPRMADFAEWAVAAEDGSGEFLNAYAENQERIVLSGLEASPVGRAVMELMKNSDRWEGTTTELHEALAQHVDDDVKRSKAWPKSAGWLSNNLRRLGSSLRKINLDITLPEQTDGKTLRINKHSLTQVAKIAQIEKVSTEHAPDMSRKLDISPGLSTEKGPIAQKSQFSEDVEKFQKQPGQYSQYSEDVEKVAIWANDKGWYDFDPDRIV